jgi:hypothetical protein
MDQPFSSMVVHRRCIRSATDLLLLLLLRLQTGKGPKRPEETPHNPVPGVLGNLFAAAGIVCGDVALADGLD